MTSRAYTEDEIQDLTDRVFLLRNQLEAGRLKFANQELAERFLKSYEAIRLRSDGKVDPRSLDGQIRTSILALIAIRQRENLKKSLDLVQIQEEYFGFLFREFGWIYDQMNESGVTPSVAAEITSRLDETMQQFIKALPNMIDAVQEFWSSVGLTSSYHIQDSQHLKAVFAGDIFPAHWENVVSTAGLYIDTIILPCPITRLSSILKTSPSREMVKTLIKHVLTAMSYRDIALAGIDPPIVIIAPNPDDTDEAKRENLVLQATPAICAHAQYLFGRKFEGVDDLHDFCGHLKTTTQVINELRHPERLVFDTEWGKDPIQQLSMSLKQNSNLFGMDESNIGIHVLSSCIGRMPQALGAQQTANHFGGTPFINAKTSWLHFTWLMEYQGISRKDNLSSRESMHVVRALATESRSNLEWLGNVPPETVLEIRKRGLANELRELLSQGVSNLIGINPDNYFRTADQVVDNLDDAFRKHQQTLKIARQKKLRLYGIDVAACTATGVVAVAAALTGNETLSAFSGLLGIAGAPNLKEIKTKFKQIAAEDKAHRESPTGLLFSHLRQR